ncbi:hypothetical protein TNCV_5124961 [Trichonephila clavipes]|nr:hypothetical protein TNCV_5124961 [Trichonephila clavipes]
MDAIKRRQSVVVQFLTAENVSGNEVYHRMQNVYVMACMNRRLVFQWSRDFQSGRSSTDDSLLLLEWPSTGMTVNASAYCAVLCKLRKNIKNLRRGMLSRRVIILKDNGHPHEAVACQTMLRHFCWDVLKHYPLQLGRHAV